MSQNDDFSWTSYGKQVLAAIKHSDERIVQLDSKIDVNHKEMLSELSKVKQSLADIRTDMATMQGQFETEKATLEGEFKKELAVMKTKLGHKQTISNALVGLASAVGIVLVAIFK